MKRKILFLDFDETLLSSDKTVSKENQQALLAAWKKGHIIAFDTGRPLRGAKKLYELTGLPQKRCFLLCYQGCYIYDLAKESLLADYPIESHTLSQLLSVLQERNIYFHAYTDDGFYCMEETEETRRYFDLTKEPYEVTDIDRILAERIYKIMAIDYTNRARLVALSEAVSDRSDLSLEHFFSSPWFYEFCGQGENKGRGLLRLCEHLGIDPSDTIAIGDEENDLSMIRAAGLGVVMCNAREEIRLQADLVTTRDNNHGGVAEIIEKYLL